MYEELNDNQMIEACDTINKFLLEKNLTSLQIWMKY